MSVSPPTLDLEEARGHIQPDAALAKDNDRKEPLFLWDDRRQKLRQITDQDLRKLCFPDWRPPMNPPVREGQPVVLSYGLGADSTALLLKYLTETDEERGFPLENLIVITALVGREWDETIEKVDRFIIPLLRQHNILTIQTGRMSDSSPDGWIIYECSRQPRRIYQDVAQRLGWTLDRNLLYSGTVPQRRKDGRLCTLRFKGEVIDAIVRHLFGISTRTVYQREIGYNADEVNRAQRCEGYSSKDGVSPSYHVGYNADEERRAKTDKSLGQGYRYEIGYNADEVRRIDESVSTWRRQVFVFPLITKYKMGREAVETFNIVTIMRLYPGTTPEAARIRKSSCSYCPFSCSSGGRDLLLFSYWAQPFEGAYAALIEMNALALNWTQFLYSKKFTVLELIHKDGNRAALELFDALIDSIDGWAVYAVRRIWKLNVSSPVRQTEVLYRGDRRQCLRQLQRIGRGVGKDPEFVASSWRVFTIDRQKDVRPSVEETFVVAPLFAKEKQGRITKDAFAQQWRGIHGQFPINPLAK